VAFLAIVVLFRCGDADALQVVLQSTVGNGLSFSKGLSKNLTTDTTLPT
jgi:hypothetical protein